MRQRNAFVLLDVVAGLTLIGILLAALTGVIVRHNHVTATLADSRSTTAAVEEAMNRLQAGAPPAPTAGLSLKLRRLDADPVDGRAWVEMTGQRGRQRITLAGLVPEQSIASWQDVESANPRPAENAGKEER
ncbi:MAG TPA: hypothetical protein VGN72_08220 [Tepidisphaeraceae bacterium]|jgi:type II secretory pathway pseudopilin PulG|nr:hypothetical protein [Tepidisphaeraceae bacterium]